MSKLIIDMPMPKDCPQCPMAHWNKLDEFTGCEVAAGKLFAATRDKEYAESICRPDWCPIKGELPDEHGDLVDVDTVLWEVPDSEGIVPPMPVTIGDLIEGYDVPIVIAAERKDDEQTGSNTTS
jgi:hypothetical protein